MGDTLTYSAQLSGGGALPSWLNFDANTRTFSGTPENGDVGTITVEVTAEDGAGATVSDSFDITVANSNDAPTLDNAITDQNATEDSAFSFTFAADTFTDVDTGDTLTYSAQLSGGGALPAWLNFDANTRTFSGTPANGDVGTITVEVTAEDGAGATVSDSFDITVANSNDAPTLDNAIADQNASEDSAFSFTFAADTFGDEDIGDTLTYSAQLSGGGALPAWLNFDANTRTFSGTPENGDVGTITVEVTAEDGAGATVSDSFVIAVANSNDSPSGLATIDGSATEGETLVANTTALNDDDGLGPFTYQWLRDGVAISGATGASYTLTQADVGSQFSYTVSYTDAGGTFEQVVSVSTAAVSNLDDPLTGQVSISGLDRVNGILLADVSALADADGIASIAYQWLRDGVAINGANEASYTVALQDSGKDLSVQVTVTDQYGTMAQSTSSNLAIQALVELPETPEPPPVVEEPTTPDPIQTEPEPEDEEQGSEVAPDAAEETEAEDETIDEEERITEQTGVFEDQASFIDRDGFELSFGVQASFDLDRESSGQPLEARNVDIFSTEDSGEVVAEEESYQAGTSDILSVNDPLFLVRANGFIKGLDSMREELNEGSDVQQAVVGSSLAVSAGMSAGYVAWLARSGVLLSSVMSTLPVWRFVDPLPVLTSTGGAAGGDGESLESLVSGADEPAADNDKQA